MGRKNNVNMESTAGNGTDIFTGTDATLTVADGDLKYPIYGFQPLATTTIAEVLNKDGEEIVLNLVTEAIELDGSWPFVWLPENAYSITFTGTIYVAFAS